MRDENVELGFANKFVATVFALHLNRDVDLLLADVTQKTVDLAFKEVFRNANAERRRRNEVAVRRVSYLPPLLLQGTRNPL